MNLSPREQQIAALLQQGKTNKQIGQTIGLSQHTVRDNISPMFARFNVKNRAALVALLAKGPSGAPTSHVATSRPASDRRTSGDRRAAERSAV